MTRSNGSSSNIIYPQTKTNQNNGNENPYNEMKMTATFDGIGIQEIKVNTPCELERKASEASWLQWRQPINQS